MLAFILLVAGITAATTQTVLPCFDTVPEARSYCCGSGGCIFQSSVVNGRGTYTCNGQRGAIGTCGSGSSPVPSPFPSPSPSPSASPSPGSTSSDGTIRHASNTCRSFADRCDVACLESRSGYRVLVRDTEATMNPGSQRIGDCVCYTLFGTQSGRTITITRSSGSASPITGVTAFARENNIVVLFDTPSMNCEIRFDVTSGTVLNLSQSPTGVHSSSRRIAASSELLSAIVILTFSFVWNH